MAGAVAPLLSQLPELAAAAPLAREMTLRLVPRAAPPYLAEPRAACAGAPLRPQCPRLAAGLVSREGEHPHRCAAEQMEEAMAAKPMAAARANPETSHVTCVAALQRPAASTSQRQDPAPAARVERSNSLGQRANASATAQVLLRRRRPKRQCLTPQRGAGHVVSRRRPPCQPL